MPRVSARLRGAIGALCATGALVGCGGGGGGGSDAATSTNATRQLTPQTLGNCPTASQSPADMDKLSCLVGHAEGVVERQAATPRTCSLDITSEGQITITTADKGSRTYTLSKGAGTFKVSGALQSVGFSEYQGRATIPSAVAGFETDGWVLGTTTGIENANGTHVADADQDEIRITYIGPANASSATQPILVVGAFRNNQRWLQDMMTCDIRW